MAGAQIDRLFRQMRQRSSATGAAAHPDPSARAFYAAAVTGTGLLAPALHEALGRRDRIDSFHLLDLTYRAARLLNPTGTGWTDFLPTLDLARYADVVATRNVVTIVPERYRGLAWFLRRLQRRRGAVRVTDWGCSTNAGLEYVQSGHPVLDEGAIDGAIGPTKRAPVALVDPVGVDAMDLTPTQWDEWALACRYGSSPPPHPSLPVSDRIPRRVLDVSKPLDREGVDLPPPDVVHCSMVSPQLSAEGRRTMLANAAMLLAPGGFVVELTFARAHVLGRAWNTVTLVHPRTEDERPGQPLTWLEWESSQCRAPRAGRDAKRIAALLDGGRTA